MPSLPRRHTAGLCHIGMSIFNVFCRGLTKENALQISFDRLLNNVVSNPYKTLRKVRLKPKGNPGKIPVTRRVTRKKMQV
jgi:hypothetical protein